MNKKTIAAAALVGALSLTGCADTSNDDDVQCTTITTVAFTPPRPAPVAPRPAVPKPATPPRMTKPVQPKVIPGRPAPATPPHGPQTHTVCQDVENA